MCQVSSPLIGRVGSAEESFNKEMELEARVAPDFELSLDDHSVLRAIQTLNFFQMKGTSSRESNPHQPC